MVKEYDIIVIGAGSGGLNIASFMNKAGFSVLLIDKTDKNIGGDCLNFGCVPSKALIHLSRQAYAAAQTKKIGMGTIGRINSKKIVEYISTKKNVIREHENAGYFRKRGINVVLGEAKFASKDSIVVNGKEYTAKKIVLATGSRPRDLDLDGLDKVVWYNNETIFNLKSLPRKMIFIGGGPIGIELGQAFSRLGVKVEIVQRGPNFLEKEDPEISGILFEQLKKEGITFHFNSAPEKLDTSRRLVIKNKNGSTKVLTFDALFVGVGRNLNIDSLSLPRAGIELDKDRRKIVVDEYLRTTNKNVLVCGDVAGGPMFTHAAELHASVILHNFFNPLKKKISYDNLSWVTYTDPEIATFGLNEKELKERGIKYEKLVTRFKDDDRAIVDDFIDGKSILYISDNKLVGGSMVTKNAGEIFQELVLANSAGLDIKEIFEKIYPYPTASRINKSLISKKMAEKLTDKSKKWLKRLY